MFEVKIETDPIFEKTEHTIKNLKDERFGARGTIADNF